MLIILIVFTAISLIGIKPRSKLNNGDYLDKKTTGAILTFCTFLIFVSHIKGYINSNNMLDYPVTVLCKLIEQLMVAPFLFYSGYGVTNQYLNKGSEYLKPFLIRRVLKIDLFYIMSRLLISFASYLMNGATNFVFDPMEFINPSWWYIFVILAEYLIAFFSFLLFKKNKLAILTFNIIGSIGLTIGLWAAGKDSWWYNTTIAFSFGVFWALYRNNLDKILSNKKNYIIICISSLIVLLLCYVRNLLYKAPEANVNWFVSYISIYFIKVVAFMLLILLFTYKFHYGNKFLYRASLYTFYIYSLQWISFDLFKNNADLLSINRYLYFFVCLAFTIIISIVAKFTYNFLWKYTFGRIKFNKNDNYKNIKIS